MDYKVKSLFDKIYRGFVRGEFGPPKIPNKDQVMDKMEQLTSLDYTPVTEVTPMPDIDIEHIRKSFSTTIDDIDILFDSIEAESKDVLDQLTNSLREHNGAKRELRRIQSKANDISNGKLGEDYLEYVFTESFDDLTSIDTNRSDSVDTEAGIFTIRTDKSNLVSLQHYAGTKLEFSIVENYSNVIDYGYIGSTDAGAILDQQDPNQLVYHVKTSKPTRLRTAFVLQLAADARPIDINAVALNVDSDIARGSIRLYYRDGYKWKDVPTISIQDIKSNDVIFNFNPVKSSHVKIEFIKNAPDVPSSNDYYYIINNVAIGKGISRRSSVIYSKPIKFEGYGNELPVVANVTASGNIEIPEGSNAKLYVTQDITISGCFLDSDLSPVPPDSPRVNSFDPNGSGSVFLSDIFNVTATISGVEPYRGIDYDWKQLNFKGIHGESVPELIEFDNTKVKPHIDNTSFSVISELLWGDLGYDGIYNASGWVNSDNDNWVILEPLVNSGILVSGAWVQSGVVLWDDIEDEDGNLNPLIQDDPDYSGQWIGYGSGMGYPFGYSSPITGRTIRFGDYDEAIDGWWRPLVEAITPSGIDPSYDNGNGHVNDSLINTFPDFYFNGNEYYTVYKFSYLSHVIEPTIRMYMYQERPVNSPEGYYPSQFIWSYKEQWIDNVSSRTNQIMETDEVPTSFEGYILNIPSGTLRQNEEYVLDAISEVRIHNSNSVIEPSEYKVVFDDNNNVHIDLSPIATTRPGITPSGITFDYKYQYRVKNEYLSTWTGFAVVSPGTEDAIITIDNPTNLNKKDSRVIKNVEVRNLMDNSVAIAEDNGGIININLPRTNTKGNDHYKITIYCASNQDNGFCANDWVPYEGTTYTTINVSPQIKLVPRLNPITIVDMSTLIYDTPMNNDNRAAVYENQNGEKYLVVKKPSKDVFPGYYFNNKTKSYIEKDETKIENIGHWIKKGGYEDRVITYTTGSDNEGSVYKYNRSDTDSSWNEGATIPDYPNYTGVEFYPHHSTYGYKVNINRSGSYVFGQLKNGDVDYRAIWESGTVGSAEWATWLNNEYPDEYLLYQRYGTYDPIDEVNRGFLFYSTSENLPTFYSIGYRSVTKIDDTNTRFLYKLELESDDEGSLVPKVRSIQFKANKEK